MNKGKIGLSIKQTILYNSWVASADFGKKFKYFLHSAACLTRGPQPVYVEANEHIAKLSGQSGLLFYGYLVTAHITVGVCLIGFCANWRPAI